MGTRLQTLTRCLTSKQLLLLPAALIAVLMATTASAQTCLQQEYNLNPKDKQNLNCSAGDVRVASVTNVRGLDGQPLSSCIEGTTFSFVADFQIVTTANAQQAGGRDNIGLYFQRDPTKPDALIGSCVDNIISQVHPCGTSGALANINCGSTGYQEADPSPDNCGDTSSSVNPSIIDTIVVTDFVCEAPTGHTTLVLPNCTSWQTPGSSSLCQVSTTNWPYPAPPAATPGAPSKCHCDTIPLPITPVTPSVIVQKACTTGQTTGPATFHQNPNTQSPTSCNAGNGTTTESEIATYTVAITNTTGTSAITIDQICDSAYGNVFTVSGFAGSACAKGSQCNTAPNNVAGGYCGNAGTTCGAMDIPASGSTTATCTFTAGPQPELTTVTNMVTVAGHADLNAQRTFTGQQSNSVSVTSTEVPTTASVTKDFGSTLAACATVRYNVEVDNTSALDEVATVSALNDSSFGSITSVHDSVLATTCSVSQSISVGGNYKCTFDAQFCSAVDANTCISHSNQVTATVKGDEASDVAFNQASQTLTVKECLTATASKQ